MNDVLQWGTIAASLCLLVLAVELARRRLVIEEYALAWITAAVGLLVLSSSRAWLHWLARLLDVAYPPSLLLLALIFVGALLAMYFTVVVSRHRRALEQLSRAHALLEERVRGLERRPPSYPEKQ